MKISVLAPNISSNGFGRAYLLAKVLNRKFDTELVGPMIGEGIWTPLSDEKSVPLKTVKMNGLLRPYSQLKKIANMIEGDIIYCSKPLFTSLGIGLYMKQYHNKPLILDIDDWEMGFAKDQVIKSGVVNPKYLLSSSIYPYKAYSIWNFLIMERFIHCADEITVSNSFLQKKYGGRIIWHGRDTYFLDPQKYKKEEAREKYKINPTANIIMFFGTPRPHKGLDHLIDSIKLVRKKNTTLVIVGMDDSQYCRDLIMYGKGTLGHRFSYFGQQPFDKVPEILSMADVIAIPQEKGHSALGQIPAKIFDAMAMAKPIIASDVSDLPGILEGCGWIVEPGNVEQLAESIQYILEHPQEADEKGSLARQKCIQNYSWDSMECVFLDLFNNFNGLQ
jgi:glycosyltransferase involved in cell wall biosynthesis